MEEDLHIGHSYGGSYQLASYDDVSADGKVIAFIEQASDRPPDICIAQNGMTQRRLVTEINGSFDGATFGHSRLINYHGTDGEELRGAILIPPEREDKAKYPVIVLIYPGASLSDRLNVFGLGIHLINGQLLATRGLAVFTPDMSHSGRFNLDSASSQVMAALDGLSQVDLADTECLGLLGHSEGGYLVNGVITITDRFRAAVSASGLCNLTSAYGHLWPNGRVYMQDEMEQFLGGSPWEVASEYVKNSPVFHLTKCTTPLLLLHGMEDTASACAQAGEMFAGLRRLGRKAQLALYPDEGHAMSLDWAPENTLDVWRRTTEWFETHLL